MNYKDSVNHNVKCWKKDAEAIREKIQFLKGKLDALEGVIECLELIEQEQNNFKNKMEKQQIIEMIDKFLNGNGLWYHFKNWLKEREDLTPSDLGLEED